jgi:predicted Zn finger-like uncharacterized protein
MIITCDKCSTNFNVPDSAIGEQGRKVKCTVCGNVWLAMKPSASTPTETAAPTAVTEQTSSTNANLAAASVKEGVKTPEKGKNVPSVVVYKTPIWVRLIPWGLSLATILLLIAIPLPRVNKDFPALAGIYESLGLISSKEVVLKNVSITKLGSETDYDVLLKGNVVNTSKVMKPMPYIRLSLYDKEGSKIISHIIPPEKEKQLNSEASFYLDKRITRLSKQVDSISTEIGTKMELILR